MIAEFRDRLPISPEAPVVTLQEGGTPLVRSSALSAATGCEVFLKYEGANPTGSFKDRGMTLAVSKAVEEGASAVVCASTGNTSASASAYAARAGLACGVVIPRGKVAPGKLSQTIVHGARVIEVEGNFDAALEIVRELAEAYRAALVNSVNPYRIHGQKTLAFEVCDALGQAPDVHVVPVGNAGNITSHWMGYQEYEADGTVERPPMMFGFQAAGAAPLVTGRPLADPETVATAIRIGNPASWEGALAAARDSGGEILAVTDEEILSAQRRIAREDGLFVEPASAASVAGLLALSGSGRLAGGSLVVCVLTGHGLKDPSWGLEGGDPPLVLPARADVVAEHLGLEPR